MVGVARPGCGVFDVPHLGLYLGSLPSGPVLLRRGLDVFAVEPLAKSIGCGTTYRVGGLVVVRLETEDIHKLRNAISLTQGLKQSLNCVWEVCTSTIRLSLKVRPNSVAFLLTKSEVLEHLLSNSFGAGDLLGSDAVLLFEGLVDYSAADKDLQREPSLPTSDWPQSQRWVVGGMALAANPTRISRVFWSRVF